MIFDILADITSPNEIDEPNSSANLAFEWLVGHDQLYLCPDDPKLKRRYDVGGTLVNETDCLPMLEVFTSM